MAAWGVECRVPFLDKDFLDASMAINPKDKMIGTDKMEKWILRKAFENELPKNILWRQKEQFSDGVGYGWIDFLKEINREPFSVVSNLHTICPSAVLGLSFLPAPPVTLSCVTVGFGYTRLYRFLMISEVILAAVGLIRRVSVVEVVFFLESHASGFQLLVGPFGGRG